MRFQVQVALLIALMLTGLVAAVSGSFRRVVPEWSPEALVGACFLIALEAGFVHHTARRDRMDLSELLRHLMPELFMLAVLMRLAASLDARIVDLPAQLIGWLHDPLQLFEPAFGLYVLVGLLIGISAHLLNHDFGILPPLPSEIAGARGSEDRSFTITQAFDRSNALDRIVGRFLGGGMLLMFALGVESLDTNNVLAPGKQISAWSAAGACIYIISGIVLYSQGRLELLRARWTLDGAIIRDEVPIRWKRLSWLVVALVVVLAGLLPRSYGNSLLAILSEGMAWLIYGLAMIGYIVMWMLGMLAMIPAWLLSLFGSGTPVAPPPAAAPPPTPPPAAAESQPQPLALAIFWACMLALMILALRTLLQHHPGLLRSLLSFGPLAWLLRTIGGLWRDSAGWLAEVGRQTRAYLQRHDADPTPARPSILRLRTLAPRELIRYFYRSTIIRAARQGLMRRPSQTPYEYAVSLSTALPDAQPDVRELTEAFVAAQYAPRPVVRGDAEQARKPWERLRRRLRTLQDQPK